MLSTDRSKSRVDLAENLHFAPGSVNEIKELVKTSISKEAQMDRLKAKVLAHKKMLKLESTQTYRYLPEDSAESTLYKFVASDGTYIVRDSENRIVRTMDRSGCLREYRYNEFSKAIIYMRKFGNWTELPNAYLREDGTLVWHDKDKEIEERLDGSHQYSMLDRGVVIDHNILDGYEVTALLDGRVRVLVREIERQTFSIYEDGSLVEMRLWGDFTQPTSIETPVGKQALPAVLRIDSEFQFGDLKKQSFIFVDQRAMQEHISVPIKLFGLELYVKGVISVETHFDKAKPIETIYRLEAPKFNSMPSCRLGSMADAASIHLKSGDTPLRIRAKDGREEELRVDRLMQGRAV